MNNNKIKKSETSRGRSPMPKGGKVTTKLKKKKKKQEELTPAPPVVPVPLGKPKVKDPEPSRKEKAPNQMPVDLVNAMIDAKYECLAKIVQDDLVAFTQSKEYSNHKGMKTNIIDFFKDLEKGKMKGNDPKLLFWTNAIPTKKGRWDRFKDGKNSGYSALLQFLSSRDKEANLQFYTAARELEECKAKPSKYWQKFNEKCKPLLDDTTAKSPRVDIGRDTLHKLEPYFVPQQLTSAMLTAKNEIYTLIELNFWGDFMKHVRSKKKNHVVTRDGEEKFNFRWAKDVPAKFLPGKDTSMDTYWIDAIPLVQDGAWVNSNLEKNLKKSGYFMFMGYLDAKSASENLLFYTRARELEQYHNDRKIYLTKFTALYQDLVVTEDEEAATINISGGARLALDACNV